MKNKIKNLLIALTLVSLLSACSKDEVTHNELKQLKQIKLQANSPIPPPPDWMYPGWPAPPTPPYDPGSGGFQTYP